MPWGLGSLLGALKGLGGWLGENPDIMQGGIGAITGQDDWGQTLGKGIGAALPKKNVAYPELPTMTPEAKQGAISAAAVNTVPANTPPYLPARNEPSPILGKISDAVKNDMGRSTIPGVPDSPDGYTADTYTDWKGKKHDPKSFGSRVKQGLKGALAGAAQGSARGDGDLGSIVGGAIFWSVSSYFLASSSRFATFAATPGSPASRER